MSLLAPALPLYGPQAFDGRCESTLPSLLDAPGALLTSSGRAAIYLGLKGLDLGPEDTVLVPTYHCPTMVSPALKVGARVAFYPITADGQANLDWLRAQAPASARVLCVAHFFGIPQDLRAIRDWCRSRSIILLEDCAHALFGTGPGGAVGSIGDIAIASLPKFLPTLDGGVLLQRAGNPPTLREGGWLEGLRVRLDRLEAAHRFGRLATWPLRRHLVQLKQRLRPALQATTANQPEPVFDPQGEYARIDVGLAQLALSRASVTLAHSVSKQRIVDTRRRHFGTLAQAFSDVPGMRVLCPDLPAGAAPYVFPLWVQSPDPAYQRLRAAGVPLSRWNWLWPDTPAIRGDLGLEWAHHVFQLPCHQDLSETELQMIIRSLLQHCRATTP